MRVVIGALLIFCAVLPAAASRLDYVAKVSTQWSDGIHEVGDPRYLALNRLALGELSVLDLETASTIVIKPRGLERLARSKSIDAEVVSYTPERIGLHVTDSTLERGMHHWYVEVDARGKILRSVSLGTFSERVEAELIGADPDHGNVWFAITRYDEDLRSDHAHVHGPAEVILRRVDQSSLDVVDAMSLALPARENKSGYEDRLSYHHARDFSRFVVVEYDERAFKPKPPAQVYIVDPEQQTSFAVPALSTTYGVAFTDHFIYLASAQLGTIARVDLAKQKIDKTVRGPLLTHDLVLVKDKLFVIGTSKKFTVCSLALACTAQAHGSDIAAAAAELSGGGSPSRDGRFYVMPAPLPADPNADWSRDVLITRFID